MRLRRDLGVLALLLGIVPFLAAADGAKPPTPAGHSAHGEAFNEGPRQKAYLMKGTGKVHFPVTTKVAEAQKFFDQGLGQLHGFWYFEAERSFRQAAALDPQCAMAYWGMAMANINNRTRAQGFIRKAVERKKFAGKHEGLWIDAYAAFYAIDKKSDRDRHRELVRRLENIIHQFPEDIEAKAFLAFHIWDNQNHGWPLSSAQAVEALIQEVLRVEPMHPVHHYRIHLWDGEDPAQALTSAARCGQSAPAIAHMWHMPGHIYSKLHRYADAAWQQEASARVDHAHMMRDRVLPDQIHNYAHNNQWLVEDLEYVGRVHDALALAKNMIELPRHPRYNTLNLKENGTPYGVHGSSAEGRRRLFETLTRFELWDEVIALSQTVYLEPTALRPEQVKRLRVLGLAYFRKGDVKKGEDQIRALEEMLARGRKGKKPPAREIDAALQELRGWSHLARGEKAKARSFFTKANDIPLGRRSRIELLLGERDKAVQLARDAVNRGKNQVHALANYVDVLQQCGRNQEARKNFEELRKLSAFIDLDVPVIRRLAPLARAMNLPADWRVKPVTPPDVGQRPDLKTLGPFRWQPVPAPEWTLADSRGRKVSLKDFRGKPVLVIFYLGSGCPHCIEQLNLFQPQVPEFEKAGIKVIAISTDSVGGLKQTFDKTRLPEEFLILSDHELKVFKAYRAYDDFEHMPLHGTFLVDGSGRVRWQDISYEPFTEVKFLLEESKRLLNLPPTGPAQVRARVAAPSVTRR